MDEGSMRLPEDPQMHVSHDEVFPMLIYGTSIKSGSADIMMALHLGYRAFDTGSNTSHNEASDGARLQTFLEQKGVARGDILIQSKFSPFEMHTAISTCPYSAADEIEVQVLKSFAHSMSNLQVDCLDVYFFHRPFERIEETLRAWNVMEDIARQGGVKHLGLSQVDAATLAQVFEQSRIRPAVVQNRHTKKNGFDVDVKRYCRERGIVYQAYGIMAEESESLLTSPCVVEHAVSTGLGTESALISLLVARETRNGLRFCVLDGSRNFHHMQNNLLAVSDWALSSPDLVKRFNDSLDTLT